MAPHPLRHLADAVPPPGREGADVVAYDLPMLCTDGARPSVTVVLGRHPPPGSERIRDLVVGARVDLRFRLIPTPGELAARVLTRAVPLWPESRSLVLFDRDTKVADAFVDRGGAQAISAHLPTAPALGLLDALFGGSGRLTLVGGVTYVSTAGLGRAEVVGTVHEVLGDRLSSDDVRLVVDADGVLEPVAPRRVSRASRRGRRTVGGAAMLMHAAGSTAAVASALQATTATPKASAVFAVQPSAHALSHIALDDLVILPVRDPIPKVKDETAPVWRDLHDDDLAWYAPEFVPVMPEPGDTVEESPFVFTFRRVGVTETGEPALRGQIRLRVKAQRSAETTTALDGSDTSDVRAVEQDGLAARVSIPFVDSSSGQARQHDLAAEITEEDDGTLTLIVDVVGDWVRLAYGALARPGFQEQPPEVVVMYRFRAAVPVDRDRTQTAFGGKAAGIALEARAESGLPRLDREDLTLRTGGRRVASFAPEPDVGTVARAGVVKPLAIGAVTVRPQVTAVAPEPERIGSRTIARRSRAELTVPCETHGHLYLDETGEPARAVGCADALQLGTIAYELFRPARGLGNDRFRVDRAVQQPGRYLIRPTTYRIGRRASDDPAGAYEPLMLLYAHLSPDASDPNRVIFDATLLPDVTAAELEQVRHDLAAVSPIDPELQLPTDLDHDEVVWHWNVAVPDTDVTAMLMPASGIRVTMDTSVAAWPLLRSQLETAGIAGQATIELSDGSSVDVGMELDLRHLVGPASGPVTAERDGDTVTLTNHAESPMAVPEVLVVDDGTIARTPVRLTLEAGGVEQVPVDVPGARVVAAHQPVRADAVVLDEVRSYVENIETTVAFVNLVNLDNHGLTRLEVDARVEGLEPDQHVIIDNDTDIGECTFVMPLTRYLRDPQLQYRITPVRDDGTGTASTWTVWDIARDGVVISLVWQDIGGEERT